MVLTSTTPPPSPLPIFHHLNMTSFLYVLYTVLYLNITAASSNPSGGRCFKVSWNNDCKSSSNFPFYLLLHLTADVCTSFPHIKTGNALAWHHVDTMYVSPGFAESCEPVSYLSMTTTHTNRKYSPSEAVSACHLLAFITCLSSRFATSCFVLLLNWICPIQLCYRF